MAISGQASLSIQIVVVGGSIAGLACAYALAKAGHRVRVLEQSGPGALDSGFRGMSVPPNMHRLLVRWGFWPQLAEHAMKCTRLTFRSADTGETVGYLDFPEQIMKALGADFLLMQQRDFYDVLYANALSTGVEVRRNALVTQVDPLGASVTLSNGEIINADLIIGADGYESLVREVVLGKRPDGVRSGLTCFSTIVPTSSMKDDDELSCFTQLPEWTTWMGSGNAIRGHLVHAKEKYALHFFGPEPAEPPSESWRDIWKMEKVYFNSYDSRIKRIVALASDCTATSVVFHEPFEHWVHEGNKIVLVGEAAHPLAPGGSHNSAMCIEDAVTLGKLFSYLAHQDQIPSLLSAYQELRQDRCAAIQKSEKSKLYFNLLPPGPEQHARDAALSQAAENAAKDWENMPEDMVSREWEEFRDLFGYDAQDAADNWWVHWGVLRERAAERHGVGGYVPEVQVSVDTIHA